MEQVPELSLFNTMGRKIQKFEPLVPGKAGFYGCGLTVYNYAHIGNLRAYVTHDILVRTLRRLGYDVTHVMNITDVGHLSSDADEGDDKMVRSAEERGKSVLEIAEFYTKAFFSDMKKLNITMPNVICKATDHIPEMITLIKRIEANGFTYFAGGNLYFDISKFPSYGDLAMLRLEDLKAGARIDVDSNKKNPGDFVLWFTKSKFENQALVWDSPWGQGYPGWHIECSAMSIKYLGETFDIHAGGIDHIPVHHTNEIAQSEAATGKHPWVKYWLHNEFLVLDKGKMSKSAGGFITLQNLIDEGYSPLDYRYFLLGGHYRSQLQFSYAALDGARNARKSLGERIRSLAAQAAIPGEATSLQSGAHQHGETNYLKPGSECNDDTHEGKAGKYLASFDRALGDDLSTPRALAELWAVVKDSNLSAANTLQIVFEMDSVLGLNLAEEATASPKDSEDSAIVEEIERLIEERKNAKEVKNYALADEIRKNLRERGIILEDSSFGTTWKKA